MAKYHLRLKARELRQEGASVKKIAELLKISKSSASIWVRDIVLTVEQLETLRKSEIKGAERGRLKSALLQKERATRTLFESKQNGLKTLLPLTRKEFLIAGLALYWGEGNKKQRRIEFCNSDPKMIQFLLRWLKECLKIEPTEITCYVGINSIHTTREQVVLEYWSSITKIPLIQFRKTSFKKVKNKKVYSNFDNHYGTLSIRVKNPIRFYYKVIGLIEALAEAG